MSFGVSLVILMTLLRIPRTRRKLLAAAERLAEWHENGLQQSGAET
jgi:hypothetical protein